MREHSVRRSLQIYERAKALIPGTTPAHQPAATPGCVRCQPHLRRARQRLSHLGCGWQRIHRLDQRRRAGDLGLCRRGRRCRGPRPNRPGDDLQHRPRVGPWSWPKSLVRIVPSAEMVRYCKGGGEACTIAVRIGARGHRPRQGAVLRLPRLARLVPGRQHRSRAAGPHLFNGIEPIGVPRCLEGTALPFTYGDVDELTALLEAHAGELACIINGADALRRATAGLLGKGAGVGVALWGGAHFRRRCRLGFA